MSRSYVVSAPKVPGAAPSEHPVATLTEARELARTFRARPDLRGQDVRIEHPNGQLVEYAGPNR